MLTKEMHKQDVEAFLQGKGDFVKIDYLNRYLKIMPPIEMRKYAYLKLAEIFLGKEMYVDAAGAFKNAAVNCVSFREKQENFLDECKAYISAGKFDNADKALHRAMDEGNKNEKEKIYSKILEFYGKEADKLKNSLNKQNRLANLYEKMMRMKLSELEREQIKEKLLKI